MRVNGLVVGMVVGLAVGVASARQPGSLSGPTVKDKPARATLVERDFKGKLRRSEVPPEEAALDLLKLDADARAKTDAVLSARAVVLDRVVIENLDLVVRLHNARQGSDRREVLAVMSEFMKKLAPVNGRGRLADEIRGTLAKDKAAEFDRILKEYREAAVDEGMAEARSRNEFVTARTLETRENLASLGLEIKRSYERQISSKAAEFDRIVSQLGLNTEQESKIRGMVLAFTQETKGQATPEQKRALFFRIMGQLDTDQQQRLMGLYLGRT
jgi:hypothetical protein